jgi:hypothetical protein
MTFGQDDRLSDDLPSYINQIGVAAFGTANFKMHEVYSSTSFNLKLHLVRIERSYSINQRPSLPVISCSPNAFRARLPMMLRMYMLAGGVGRTGMWIDPTYGIAG